VFTQLRTLVLVTVFTSGILAQSEQTTDLHDSLASARQLYASADYQGALDLLDRLAATNPPLQERQSIDLYRIFCFVALGRTGDADGALVAMVTRDPWRRPADSEIPPRLRPMFSDKRKEVLPSIIQAKYQRAKEVFDRKEYKGAVEGFTEVLLALSDPDVARQAGTPPLSDLRVLAIGFKDLALTAMTTDPAPQVTTPRPTQRPESTTPTSEALPAAATQIRTIYDSGDTDVIAPVTVRQEMPRFYRPITTERVAVLFIVIDEMGRVESAMVTTPLDSYYNAMLMQTAKTWRYQPARRNGVAVKYRKSIQFTLSRQTY
jgi:hypothetical protein